MKKTVKEQPANMNRRKMLQKTGLAIAAVPFYFGLKSCISGRKTSFDVDVIVVGAGLSGLNAALLFEEYGYKTMVVEGTDRIGGRVHTVKDSLVPGHPEMGANQIGDGYARIIDMAKKTKVDIVSFRPRTEIKKEDYLYALKNQLISVSDWPNHHLNPYTEDWAKSQMPSSPQWTIYSKTNPLPKNDLTAWRNQKYAKYDRSVYDLLKDNGFSEEAIRLGASTNSGYGTDAKDLSALMYYQILNFITQQTAIKSNGGGAAKGGNQRIPEAMANALSSDVRMKSPVKHIDSQPDGVTVFLENDKKLRAKYVVVTLPTSALRRITLSPAPPILQQKGIQELGYTPCVQIHFVPTKKYWEEDGLPASMWTDQLSGRFLALKNNLNNPDEITSCVAYTNGNVALSLDKMGEQQATEAVLDILTKIRPSLKDALHPVHYWTWSNNRFAGGAYAYWKPGQITEFANELAKPVGRIHFAGEHTAVLARGMEGAMESGERAALEIMNLL